MALALLWLKFGEPVSTERTSLRCFHMVGEAEEKETETTARWGGAWVRAVCAEKVPLGRSKDIVLTKDIKKI